MLQYASRQEGGGQYKRCGLGPRKTVAIIKVGDNAAANKDSGHCQGQEIDAAVHLWQEQGKVAALSR